MTQLTVEALLELYDLGIKLYSGFGRIPAHARGRLESVLYTAAYPHEDNILGYAAAVLFYIARAQHFPDGNKRLAWAGCVRALEINGLTLNVSTDEAYRFVLDVVENKERTIRDVADQLAEWLIELPDSGGTSWASSSS